MAEPGEVLGLKEKRKIQMECALFSANGSKNPVLPNSKPNDFPIAIESKAQHIAMDCNTKLWTKLLSCSQNTLLFAKDRTIS